MTRLSLAEAIGWGSLRCPRCRGGFSLEAEEGEEAVRCQECGAAYPAQAGIPSLLPEADGRNDRVREFWGALYDAAYREHDERMGRADLLSRLDDLLEMFRHRRHLAAVEMPLGDLEGKRVLEVGSGAGGHSALFSRLGARVFSVDITPQRVVATAAKLDLLGGAPKDLALQGDASALPFPDDFFDIAYSNGVLHHTPYVGRAVEELHRTLKPEGRAVVMLYAKNSFLYRGVLFPVKGILLGGASRNRDWLGRATEWMSSRRQRVYNPKTEVFSGREIERLFARFRTVSIRKGSFTFDQIPLIGKLLGKVAGRRTGYNPGGVLVYGFPWRNETSFELWAGRGIGFALNISATK
ncbi:MAG: methyltransferase domain-containing protein [Candidatus Tectomicrobia bacterium]|uniref:Methyltransferase domain-containing protein n=1 Tax=Tectimicrobiota bacterium TaxID=2528274 RepID=A0A932HY79_UNCTE|nr:methyltransferase domain-containing protein [Candidatus Tectomicrobia bacterium]